MRIPARGFTAILSVSRSYYKHKNINNNSQLIHRHRHLDFHRSIATTTTSLNMFETRELFGKTVQVQIPADVFPTDETIQEIDNVTGDNCQHGWYESTSDQGTYGGSGPANLHYRYWLPSGDVKGILVFSHGIQLHSGHAVRIDGRLLDMALLVDTFTAKGIGVYAMDQHGHGFSEGTRFYMPSWEQYLNDTVGFIKLVTGKHPTNIPLFLSGESFGGSLTVLASRYFQNNPEEAPPNLDSCLLVCPAIIGDVPPFPITQILRYILKPMAPTWTPFFMPNPISPDRIFRCKKVLGCYTEPKMAEMGLDQPGTPFRLGTAVGLLGGLEEARANAIPGFTTPFCIVHGANDEAVPLSGSELLFEKSSTPDADKEFHTIPEAFHGLMADPKAEEAVKLLTTFVDARLEKFVVPK